MCWQDINALLNGILARSNDEARLMIDPDSWRPTSDGSLCKAGQFIKAHASFAGAKYLTGVKLETLKKMDGNQELKNGGGFSGPSIMRLVLTYDKADQLPDSERPSSVIIKTLDTNALPEISVWNKGDAQSDGRRHHAPVGQ